VPKSLKNSRVLLGVTGSVAAYKAIDLIRGLKKEEARVTVVMTGAAKEFVTALSLELASGGKVYTGLFDEPMSHIELPRQADIMVIAPATANTIAKTANGLADDLLSACFLAFRGPAVIAPAMNWRMYESPALKRNLSLLGGNVTVVPPERGLLACGEEGIGRMAQTEKIIEAIKAGLIEKDLTGKHVLVTAGPTREYMDEVRFISNKSTGKMGYALAAASKARGADVTLVSGPSSLAPPEGVRFIPVETAVEMRDAVLGNLRGVAAVIMAAAPADFYPAARHKGKPDKASVKSVALKKTPDILKGLSALPKRPLLIGFSAEFGNDLERARRKLREKGADMMVFNDVSRKDSGFGSETNQAVLIGRGFEEALPLMTKEALSHRILDRLVKLKGL